MQIIGLLLFKYYDDQALEPFLKLLCSSCLRCRTDETYGVAKTILAKIVQRHSISFFPCVGFFSVNIDIDSEPGKICS